MQSDSPHESHKPVEGLQFDRAEPNPSAETVEGASADQSSLSKMQCTLSGEDIQGVYYEVNGQVLSEDSYRQVEAARQQGTWGGRFSRAAMFGAAAGALGALIYYFFLAVVGLEWAVISIVVGYMVGYAVSMGSRNRGGLAYQFLAVVLTYLSIVGAYVPLVAEELRNVDDLGVVETVASEETTDLFERVGEQQGADEQQGAEASSEPVLDPETSEPMETVSEEPMEAVDEEAAEPTMESASFEDPRANPLVFGILVLGLSFFAPFLGGMGSILTVLIIGFGLYQAWQMNAEQAFEVAGPFQVGAGSAQL